jgi:hypothetical protein
MQGCGNFAHDLLHLDQVRIEDRREALRHWDRRKHPKPRAMLYYGALVVILLLFCC